MWGLLLSRPTLANRKGPFGTCWWSLSGVYISCRMLQVWLWFQCILFSRSCISRILLILTCQKQALDVP